ncbi:PREDICTED: condensin complex subunit 2 [Dinoponera quadriceps]|uniref:Condensin complex subunit 2 n=1 Tax=Dinoponera quadriceps TaxID=609295 RepID=A0A6P3WPH1_DINQU|nr:PREDICTED: condensin complex subunit 2 [Dinoponera quadriceps]XP_014468045.1 PREDICTED: condensin complex subunit 2 [Dinoponera quadriceps]
MKAHKSKPVHKWLESSLNKSPASSSPLRRKTIIAQKQLPNVLSENDDEAERIARRREMLTRTASMSSPTTPSVKLNKRHSLGLTFLANVPASQMAESINQCIKLSTENKINVKNAFSLEMIDFMTYMIKKQDNNMSNLQVASTSLDVSSKIYGFRVDSVHTEILKIVGGLDKQEDAEQDQQSGEMLQDNTQDATEVAKKKKKKRVRQKICSTVEALRGNIEIVKPSMMIGEGDLHTSDMLYQAMLPNHASSGFYHHLYNDVLVDVVEEECNVDATKYVIPAIKDFRNLEICLSYSNFQFLGWSVKDEPEKVSDTSAVAVEEDGVNDDDDDDNRFQFDLDATVQHDEEDANPASKTINYFDIETQDDGTYEYRQQQKAANRAENIVDAAEPSRLNFVIPEYSFMSARTSLHWAGPSHWKFHNFAKSRTNADDKVIGTCMQAPLKKRKEFELPYEGNKDVMKTKFAPSQSNKLQAKTAKAEWSAESLTFPEDFHYDIRRMVKLYLHQYLSRIEQQDNGDRNMPVTDVFDSNRYDYNNPNDTLEYCPDVINGDYDDSRDNNGDENECNFEDDNNALAQSIVVSQGFTGDNLIAAPKLANKILIAYCSKAKKIDMRQLKKSMWKCLRLNNADNEEQADKMMESKQFSDIYKTLPRLLSKDNVEALSVPLSFASLLHLANEKTLNLCSLPDMSDVTVEDGISGNYNV